MKIKMVLAVLILGVLTGCAGMMFETGVKREGQISNLPVIDSKIIYYKPVLYKSGFQRWSFVGNKPEPEPSQALIEFKNAFLANTASIFKENGYEFVEIQNNPSENPPIYIEVRLAFRRGIPVLVASTGGTRWFVHFNGEYVFEIYEWQLVSVVGIGGEKSAGQDLSKKSVEDFLKQIKKISTAQSP
ncbi:MAG: hypothetical protein AAB496_02030 [Patescibacteria group bacterium]